MRASESRIVAPSVRRMVSRLRRRFFDLRDNAFFDERRGAITSLFVCRLSNLRLFLCVASRTFTGEPAGGV